MLNFFYHIPDSFKKYPGKEMVAVFTVNVLIMCFVWLFQIMVLTCSDVIWIFPIAWQNGQKGKNNHSQAHCSIKYIVQYSLQMMFFFFFFCYSKFRSQLENFKLNLLDSFSLNMSAIPILTTLTFYDCHNIQGNQNRVTWLFIIMKTNLLLYLIIIPLLNCILNRLLFYKYLLQIKDSENIWLNGTVTSVLVFI